MRVDEFFGSSCPDHSVSPVPTKISRALSASSALRINIGPHVLRILNRLCRSPPERATHPHKTPQELTQVLESLPDIKWLEPEIKYDCSLDAFELLLESDQVHEKARIGLTCARGARSSPSALVRFQLSRTQLSLEKQPLPSPMTSRSLIQLSVGSCSVLNCDLHVAHPELITMLGPRQRSSSVADPSVCLTAARRLAESEIANQVSGYLLSFLTS